MDSKRVVETIYRDDTGAQWGHRTMEHASGVWGREPMLKYLQEEIIKKADTVIDLGCGGGHPTIKVAEMAGEKGRIVGIDCSPHQLELTQKFQDHTNVTFASASVTSLPYRREFFDKAVSFMVLHNLNIEEVRSTFQETARVLKVGGQAVFLTMHPEVLESTWDLDFWRCNEDDIQTYKEAIDKEGVTIRSRVKNCMGSGQKDVMMNNHTRTNMEQAISAADLRIVAATDLWIDRATAEAKFGKESVVQVPSTPTFWRLTLAKD